MNIAILGASSLIAKDLVCRMLCQGDHELKLFSRDTAALQQWLDTHKFAHKVSSLSYSEFNNGKYDAIINFVGVGDPSQIQALAGSILDITFQFDEMVLSYLARHPECKYIFLSSGAAYGSNFETPATSNSCATVEINNLSVQNWYGIAKLYSECRHRALSNLNIVDVRVFNYISRSQNLSARFLITDMLRAIRDDVVFKTGSEDLVRDYLHPDDFYALILAILASAKCNTAVDCYTKSPISKNELLRAMAEHFGLQYDITVGQQGVAATGSKTNYYSLNRKAAEFGYIAKLSSLEGIIQEATAMLERK
ncbi:MAG: NAD-dependent epimerase/dehydratase family protein [Burkholderiales bacterium]|uniref:NAD-dependent epimerase/dehydratase family protein n=1 Tax=Limnobacter sp. TaxID=2003368 RepID=UPI003961A392|nr:NAD-dependent epimerase/dehydratase family protein [Burkholderiales bacterium]